MQCITRLLCSVVQVVAGLPEYEYQEMLANYEMVKCFQRYWTSFYGKNWKGSNSKDHKILIHKF